MIKCDNGFVAIKGTKLDLMSELTTIINYMMEKGVINNDTLNDCVSLACLSKNKIKELALEAIDEMDNIGDALKLLQYMENHNA